MSLRSSLMAVMIMVAAAVIIFHSFQRRLSSAWFALAVHPEIFAVLDQSLADQKALANHDPTNEAAYRQRFDQAEVLGRRLRILEHNRQSVMGRYELILLAVLSGAVMTVIAATGWRQHRQSARLLRLQQALVDLAEGGTDLDLGDRRRDLIGRIAAMIEHTSRRMVRDRQRLKTLENLSTWQEAARRHAHEMRTPLTGARLELERLVALGNELDPTQIRKIANSAAQEIERLADFTRQFTSFARLPSPDRTPHDLTALVREFTATFAHAWPNLVLTPGPEMTAALSAVDRDMLRQVLVNLCDNASLAIADRGGRLDIAVRSNSEQVWLDVSDDGPGVAPTVRDRLFEPYVTTRAVGNGMGLGLAISKKIMLDHDGDLELLRSGTDGTTFRVTLPKLADQEAIR